MKINTFQLSLICLILFCSGLATAQTPRGPGPYDWWYTLEQGKQMFKQGDYGTALLTFEDARRQRQTMFTRMERDLIDLLSIYEVRRLGDSLDWIERYIDERHYDSAAAALQELYFRIPKETFNNSVTAALDALGTLKDYPEAEQWIGETYLVEGELTLALNQFQKTLVMRDLFENPDYATEMLYKIAGIRRLRQEYTEMERILLSILANDRLWSSEESSRPADNTNGQPDSGTIPAEASTSFARQAMTRTLENNGIDRYITLYRYSNNESAHAHRLLGFYYYISGRHARAQEHLMFAFLIQNTVIIDEIVRRRFDYSFTSLNALASEINRNPILLDYTEKNEYYKTAYYLGTSLYGNGKTIAAVSIWNFLAAQNNAGEWQQRARSQLQSPHVERGLEMP